MNVLFAYQQIDAGDCEHNDKQDDCRCGCVGRVAAGVAVEHVVDIAHNGVPIYFLPYVTNTLAVGLVFMILFKKTA